VEGTRRERQKNYKQLMRIGQVRFIPVWCTNILK